LFNNTFKIPLEPNNLTDEGLLNIEQVVKIIRRESTNWYKLYENIKYINE